MATPAETAREADAPPCRWCRLQGLAARLLGWTPATFWAATPKELADCLGVYTTRMPQGRPLTRRDFDDLRRTLGELTTGRGIGDKHDDA